MLFPRGFLVQNEREPNRDTILKTCYKKAVSKEDFFEKVKKCGAVPYVRGGKISGVVFRGRKYRLKMLGFGEKGLEMEIKRHRELRNLRDKVSGKGLELD